MPASQPRAQMYCIIQHKNTIVKKKVEEIAHYEMQYKIAAIEAKLNLNTAEIEEMMIQLVEFMKNEQSDNIEDIRYPIAELNHIPRPEFFDSENARLNYYSSRIDYINSQIGEVKRLFRRAIRNRNRERRQNAQLLALV